MATPVVNQQLILDQSIGVQNGPQPFGPANDDVAISIDGITGEIVGGLDDNFEALLATLGLSPAQKAFADAAEGASQSNMISVTVAANEVVDSLIFAPLTDSPAPFTAIDGGAIVLNTSVDGKSVIATDADGDIVAVIYMIPAGDNLSATLQMITFEPISHTVNPDPDDNVNFGNLLAIRAVSHVDTPVGEDIGVDDDGPSIVLSGDEETLTVDETVLAMDDTKSFAGAFDSDPGTDGGAATPITYALSAVAGASGLTDTASGQLVNLSTTAGGVVEGRTATGNDLVFTVSVAANGDVTLNQLRAVVHTDIPTTTTKPRPCRGTISLR